MLHHILLLPRILARFARFAIARLVAVLHALDEAAHFCCEARVAKLSSRHLGAGLPMSASLIKPITDFGALVIYLVEVSSVAVIYLAVAKLSLALASIHPSATPIWPPTGFALAVVLLLGHRIWPAIYLAAFIANVTTAGSTYTSLAIAAGNTLESVVGAYLINRWSNGLGTFDTPTGVAKFALICCVPSTMISATLGVGTLSLSGYADWVDFISIWMTWWMGDLAGALVLTPVILLWTMRGRPGREEWLQSCAVFGAVIVVGLIAFSPLIEQTPSRGPLAFLAVLPLMWAALRCNQRDTATTALILVCFAIWGTASNGGPFARSNLNDSFLLKSCRVRHARVIASLEKSADRRAGHGPAACVANGEFQGFRRGVFRPPSRLRRYARPAGYKRVAWHGHSRPCSDAAIPLRRIEGRSTDMRRDGPSADAESRGANWPGPARARNERREIWSLLSAGGYGDGSMAT